MAEGETEEEEGLITAGLCTGEDVIADICLGFRTRQTPRSRGEWGSLSSFTI